MRSVKEAFKGFGGEILESIRNSHREIVDDAVFEEKILGIENAKWKFTKEKKYLLVTIFGGGLTLLFLVKFVFDTLGVVVA